MLCLTGMFLVGCGPSTDTGEGGTPAKDDAAATQEKAAAAADAAKDAAAANVDAAKDAAKDAPDAAPAPPQ